LNEAEKRWLAMSILETLIEQSKNPSGRLGQIMLKIMNNAHRDLTLWGLSQLQSCKNILDVSCGGGNAIHLMAESNKFEKIYGIDFSQDAVELSIKKNQKDVDDGSVIIKQASVLDLPFDNNYFDAITTFQSHYHWPEILKAMKEIHRVLKPGGRFMLTSEIYKIEYHMKEYNTSEKTKLLFEDCGFKNISLTSKQKCICVVGFK
jgi:ubiquinone/menaquinone biosynthesis C-methylase UbiE